MQDYAEAVQAARESGAEDAIVALAQKLYSQGTQALRVAPDSAINRIRADRGLQPISSLPAGVDALTWRPDGP